jgi:Tol biopolymer transport system component
MLLALSVFAGSAVVRVSTSSSGAQANAVACARPNGETKCNARSSFQSISADGRYGAFTSIADNLVANDTNETADIFVKDRLTGAVVRVSTDANGIQANEAAQGGFTGSHHPSISADGRFIAFESYASNLVPGDTNDRIDVFVKDIQTGAIIRILFNGSQGDESQFRPVLSANGRYVAFISTSRNIYPSFASTFRMYRYDTQTGGVVTVAGGQSTISDRDFDVNSSSSPAISADGRYIAISAKEVGFTWWRVIRRDMVANSLSVASVTNDGHSANGHSSQGNALAVDQNLDMTPDGRYVVFTSDAINLDPGDTTTNRDVYLRDFQTQSTNLVTKNSNNVTLGKVSYNVSISADGRFIAFDSSPNGSSDVTISVLDRQFNLIRNAPYTTSAAGGGTGLYHPVLSDNGRFLSFYSNRSDLIPNDTNSGGGLADVFRVDLLASPSHRNQSDFDGEGLADFSVFRPSNGNWYWLRSNDFAYANPGQWGLNGDLPVAADFDGDAKTDLAVFRPSNGFWYMIRSATNTLSSQQWGLTGDRPVAGDYDGDSMTDLAVWRPSDTKWYIALSGGGFRIEQWGLVADRPVVGDFDGNGKTDLVVYRPANGTWYMREDPQSGADRSILFGLAGDRPVPADYNGDGITDLAVYRPSNGTWYFNKSRRQPPNSSFPLVYDYSSIQWGLTEDLPVPSDFDGDGRADISLFRPSEGVWYQIQSLKGENVLQFGLSGDVPVGYASESQ